MNGDSAVSAAASAAARRVTVRSPSRYTSGIVAVPATSAARRRSSGLLPA